MAQTVDQNFLNTDPGVQQILHQFAGQGNHARNNVTQAVGDYLAQKGLALPDRSGVSPSGQLTVGDDSILPVFAPIAATAIPALAGAAAGPAGAAVGGTGGKLASNALGGNNVGDSGSQGGGGSSSFSGQNLAGLGMMIPALIMMMKNMQTPGTQLASIPGGQELLNSMITTNRQQAPLRQGVLQTAAGMLPKSSFPGGQVPNLASIAPANYAPAQSSSGDLSNIMALLGAGGGGFLAGKYGGSILNAFKNLIHGGGGNSGAVNYPNAANQVSGGVNPWPGGVDLPPNLGPVDQSTLPGYDPGPSFDPSSGYDPLGQG